MTANALTITEIKFTRKAIFWCEKKSKQNMKK